MDALLLLSLGIQAVFIAPDFLAAPPQTVVIPLGGGANLNCLYGNPKGIPRKVAWYRQTVIISGAVEGCRCRSQSDDSGTNLTFYNFMRGGAGKYSCQATVPNGFDECTTNVILAGKCYYSYVHVGK